ncbi:MAG: hypothetical protein QOD77_1724 [Thermoplasmata archaeon]|jgi:PAS domain-containing protein|nr:hypothetical protein [Thermoplasmata archaeon]
MARGAAQDQARFGLPGIFDNVRDGLVLVRFPGQEVVLFNRAAKEMSGLPVDQALGARLNRIFTDPDVTRIARACSEQEVGEWPGHAQDILRTRIQGPLGHSHDVELSFCRVDDVGLGGPLVLLVMRPQELAELESDFLNAKKAHPRVAELAHEAQDEDA